MKFAHLADIHIGYFQYGLVRRAHDIANSWLWACRKIAEEQCDFVVLPGDLFHHKQVDPTTMSIACTGLRMMKCPVFMIKGNHEKMRTANEQDWIDFLVSEELVVHIEPAGFEWYLDDYQKNVRIFGIDWVGMATNQVVSRLMIPSAEEDEFTILMLHAGMEDVLPQNHPGTISWEVLSSFVGKVDYVALGHVHKPLISHWVNNPGSLESISADEYKWQDRGLLINDVAQDGTFTTQLHIPPRRHFEFIDDELITDSEISKFCNNAVVIVKSQYPETVMRIQSYSNPLYIKYIPVKKETEKVQIQTFSKFDMELEAIRQLTEIEPEKVLEMKGIKDGPTIWQTIGN